jgi:Arc/MetJ family transcription regulator
MDEEDRYYVFLFMRELVREKVEEKKKMKKRYSQWTRLLTDIDEILEYFENDILS